MRNRATHLTFSAVIPNSSWGPGSLPATGWFRGERMARFAPGTSWKQRSPVLPHSSRHCNRAKANCSPREFSINVSKHLRDMVNPSERRLISFFAAIWLFIVFVSVVDGYLVYRHRQQMLQVELNPIGRALIQWNGGQIWYLLLAKLVGTVAACAALLVIHR